MFMLYALVAGVGIGLIARGRLGRLALIPFRLAPLAFAGLAVQVLLFAEPVAGTIGDAGPPIYVGSTAAVLVAVLANLRLPGLPLVAAGAASNLAAIVANGGIMPVSSDALAAIGRSPVPGFSNSVERPAVALAPLTDIFAMPSWLPLANVFSVGDVLIGLGAAAVIVTAMRNPRLDPPAVRAGR